MRLRACAVAEDVLPLFEAAYPADPSPRNAILTARRFVFGEATGEELDAAGALASFSTSVAVREKQHAAIAASAAAGATCALEADYALSVALSCAAYARQEHYVEYQQERERLACLT